MKKTISLVLALVMCLSLFSCGKSDETLAINPVVMMPSDMGGSQNNASGEENNSQFTAYAYDGEPTDLLTVEEVVLMPERFPMAVMDVSMNLNWKVKVRNTSGEDIPLNSYMCVWYRYLDENEDTLFSLQKMSNPSSSVKNDRASWLEVSEIPTGWSDEDTESIAYLEIYAYAIGTFSRPQYEFENPVLIDVREIFDWDDIQSSFPSGIIYTPIQ